MLTQERRVQEPILTKCKLRVCRDRFSSVIQETAAKRAAPFKQRLDIVQGVI